MARKNLFRLLFLGLLAFFAFTCNVTEVGPDTLTFSVGDSLKYPNYDSIQLHVFVIPTPNDTTFRKVAFHGRYDSAAQLKKLILGKLPSHTFIVVVKAFRKNVAQLVIGVNFIDGKVGKIDTILLPTDTTRRVNHRPILSLASPDNGKTVFPVNEGATLSFNLAVKDTDAGDAGFLQPLTESYCGAMTLDTANKSFSFQPTYTCIDSSGDSLVYNLEFKAKDRGAPILWDTLRIKIVVYDKETPPRWKNIQPTVIGKEGRLMSLALDSLFLGDNEGDSVFFTASQGTMTTSPLVWDFTPSFSQAGQDTVFLTATDNHKPPMSSQFAIKLVIADSIRPVDVVITYPPNGFITRNSQVAVSWKVNGTSQSTQLTELLPLEGQNLVRRFYRDTTTGDTASDIVMVIRDQLPPSKPVVTAKGLTNNQKPNWHWHSGGNNGAGLYRFKLDDKNLMDTNGVLDTTFTPVGNLSEGIHKLYAQERDIAGNWSLMDSLGIAQVDITAPVVTIQSPLDSLVTNQANVQMAWKIDGVTQTSVAKSLVEGVNTLTQTAPDSAGNVGSASITVTRRSNVIFVDAAAAAGGDGNTWGTAYRYLQTALSAATSGKELWVAKGIYKPVYGLTGKDTAIFDTSFVMKSGVSMYGGFNGGENTQGKRNFAFYESILSGYEVGSTRILEVANNSVIDGLVLEKASVKGNHAAMNVSNGSPKIINCIFRDNINNYLGAPAIFTEPGTSPTIMDCRFLRNRNENQGGDMCGAIMNSKSSPIITNCEFSDNYTLSSGGAIHNSTGSSALISGCVFMNNKASSGGGISDFGFATIQNNIFVKNEANNGGAINLSKNDGVLKNNIFIGNTAGNGGAIAGYADVNVLNCVFVNNTANRGGAITIYGDLKSSIKNSIFFGNVATDRATQIDGSITDTLQITYTDFQGGLSSIYDSIGGTIQSSNLITTSPLFKNISDPAGPDGKYFTADDGLNLSAPLGSPCINAGDPSTTGLPTTDITGAPRIQGGRVDMGAYEQ